jgi:hypothetical protein
VNRTVLSIFVALSLSAISAHAESPDRSGQFAVSVKSSVTRSHVLGELKQAQRTGDILAAGERGGTLYELNPHAYPMRAMLAGKTREQVRDETLQAIRDGDIIHGELGLPQRELFPGQYMARTRTAPAGLATAVPMAPMARQH